MKTEPRKIDRIMITDRASADLVEMALLNLLQFSPLISEKYVLFNSI